MRRLGASIIDENFEKFKFIFDNEYMKPEINNWFEFQEEWYDSFWNFYPLCTCWCKSKECKKCDPIRVHRNLYVLQCNCANGKRYIAFKLFEFITNEYQKMTDHIISLGPIILHHTNMIDYS